MGDAHLAVRPDGGDPPAVDRDRTVDEDPPPRVQREDSPMAQ
jgi:hypothetical protein